MMATAAEKAIHQAFADLFGNEQRTSTAPVKRDPLYLRALAAAPDQDDDAVDLIERHLSLQLALDRFGDEIEQLVTKHAGDARFAARCRKALAARADLAGLEQRMLLTDWWPPLRHTCLPM